MAKSNQKISIREKNRKEKESDIRWNNWEVKYWNEKLNKFKTWFKILERRKPIIDTSETFNDFEDELIQIDNELKNNLSNELKQLILDKRYDVDLNDISDTPLEEMKHVLDLSIYSNIDYTPIHSMDEFESEFNNLLKANKEKLKICTKYFFKKNKKLTYFGLFWLLAMLGSPNVGVFIIFLLLALYSILKGQGIIGNKRKEELKKIQEYFSNTDRIYSELLSTFKRDNSFIKNKFQKFIELNNDVRKIIDTISELEFNKTLCLCKLGESNTILNVVSNENLYPFAKEYDVKLIPSIEDGVLRISLHIPNESYLPNEYKITVEGGKRVSTKKMSKEDFNIFYYEFVLKLIFDTLSSFYYYHFIDNYVIDVYKEGDIDTQYESELIASYFISEESLNNNYENLKNLTNQEEFIKRSLNIMESIVDFKSSRGFKKINKIEKKGDLRAKNDPDFYNNEEKNSSLVEALDGLPLLIFTYKKLLSNKLESIKKQIHEDEFKSYLTNLSKDKYINVYSYQNLSLINKYDGTPDPSEIYKDVKFWEWDMGSPTIYTSDNNFNMDLDVQLKLSYSERVDVIKETHNTVGNILKLPSIHEYKV